jgi:hypothetical protein
MYIQCQYMYVACMYLTISIQDVLILSTKAVDHVNNCQLSTVKQGVLGKAEIMAQRQAVSLQNKLDKKKKKKESDSDEDELVNLGGREEETVEEEEEEDEDEEDEEEEDEAEEERETGEREKVFATKKIDSLVALKKKKVLHINSKVLIMFILFLRQLNTDTLFV